MPLPPSPGARRGVALIVTLAILTIVSTMLIGFVLSTRQDRGATQSYSDSLRADQLALGGLDAAVSSLRAEIACTALSSNFTSNSFTVYFPLAATNLVPQRTVSTASLYPLLKVSGGTSFTSNGTSVTNLVSSGILSSAASLNNRTVSLTRWNKPQLVLPANTNSFPSPAWIVVGRTGPFSPSSASPVTAGATPGLGAANEVLGRFAYTVYDLGGLLDINVAGFPSGASGASGLMPWADLSQISTSPDLLGLPTKRNAGSSASFSTYLPGWATNGFLTVGPGDTTLFSRQELIDYAKSKGFTAALPYLTVFSRELNGPTWSPSQPPGVTTPNYVDTKAFQGQAGVSNFFLLARRVTSTGWTRNNGTTPVLNEPLVKYRFPLGKLSLLQVAATAPAAVDATLVGKYFGLVLDTGTGAYKKWIYTSPDGAATRSPATFIKSLDAIGNREPDFFELLKATILTGSLGMAARHDELATANDPDAVRDNQIIQIGLNIIDQSGPDNLPSTISFSGGEFYGVKDLPYISQVFITCISSHPLSTPANASLFFNLWNPHQTTAGAIPQLRLIPLGDTATANGAGAYTLQYVIPNATAIPASDTWSPTSNGTLSAASGSIVFSPALSKYRTPELLTGGTLSGIGATLVNGASGFNLAGPAIPSGASAVSTPNGVLWSAADTTAADQWRLSLKATNLSFALQYEYPVGSGTYHTYGVFAGKVSAATSTAFPVNAGLKFGNTTNPLILNSTPDSTVPVTAPYGNSYYLTKSDPRTSRWSAFWNENAYTSASHALGGGNFIPWRFLPFNNNDVAPPGPSAYDISQWCANTTGTSAYSDSDGLTRPGDSSLGVAGSDPFGVSTSQARPLVMERAFASVGELGYAFRDMPWKSLDFSSNKSADAGLLDAFTVSGGQTRRSASGQIWETAGRISPNSPIYQPLAALLSGAQKDFSASPLSASDAAALAQALTNLPAATPYGMTNRADLASRFMTNTVVAGKISSGIKTEREAVVRALAESSNTRTWNLLVDVVAQTGHYPPTATSFAQFVVTGERRYWLHVAIDRYTGEIVDEQLEAVSE